MRKLSSLLLVILTLSFVLVLASCSKDRTGKTKFIYEKADDHITITGYSGIEEEISVPSELEGLPVTVIAENAFYGTVNLKKVVIPDSVKVIDYAFTKCPDLEFVQIGNGVLSMNGAFKDCEVLKTVVGGANATEMAEAYMNCASLTNGFIPSGAVSCSYAFSGCKALTSITVANGVTSLPFTFSSCTSLTEVVLPLSVTSLVSTFEGCTALTNVTGLENVIELDASFKNCSALTVLTLGEKVNVLKEAFVNCASLASVSGLPTSVQTYTASFTGCSSIASITIPEVTGEDGLDGYMFVDDIKGCSSLTTLNAVSPFLVTAEFCKTFEESPLISVLNLHDDTVRSFLRVDSTYVDSLYTGTKSTVTKAVTNCKKNSKVRVVDDYGFINDVSYTHIHGGDVEGFDPDSVASETDVVGFESFNKTYYWCGYPKGTNYKTQTVAIQRDYTFFLRVTGKSSGALPGTVTVNGMNCVIESE